MTDTASPLAALPAARSDLTGRAAAVLSRRGRWKPAEIVFWLIAGASFFLLPDLSLIHI